MYKLEIIELRSTCQDYQTRIEKYIIRIRELEAEIASMRLQIEELRNRPVQTNIVEKIVEKIVYRDREVRVERAERAAESDIEQEIEEHESIEENFEVVGRVKVGESSAATFANLENSD